ncbi:uncharacterized protein LOC125827887 [Solanum verrucosum]|uniref:uncharacterized protein LOC125827887 n=1 Tax=Solanum verrucosum TaxID=315347 RepID=UPI0020D015BD|nr:uncharacterized protein LOC125827887 [Solanum verrucosum]
MVDLGFYGSKYTWCNNRRPGKQIWKRLERLFINADWNQPFQNNNIEHLARTASDHRPLRLYNKVGMKPLMATPMWILQTKLKRLGRKLSQWSRSSLGDIHDQVIKREAKIQMLEDIDLMYSNDQGREELNKAPSEYTRWGKWVHNSDKIAKVAVRHFKKLFNLHNPNSYGNTLDYINSCITDDDNEGLIKLPEEDEIRNAVFDMSPAICRAPDGFNGRLITENILSAQEIAQDITKYNKGGNIIIKLDMSYDRMSWSFLHAVLLKFGFAYYLGRLDNEIDQ